MAEAISAERALAALEAQQRLRLGLHPDKDGGWRVRTKDGTFVGSTAAPTQVEAIEVAVAAIETGERREELQELRNLAAALSRGRYYPVPKLSSREPQILTFDVIKRDGGEKVRVDVTTWEIAAAAVLELDAADAHLERAAAVKLPQVAQLPGKTMGKLRDSKT